MSYDDINPSEIPLTVNPYNLDPEIKTAFIEGTNITPIASIKHVGTAENTAGFTTNLIDNDVTTYYELKSAVNTTGAVILTLPYRSRPLILTSLSYALDITSISGGGATVTAWPEISEDNVTWKTLATHNIGAVSGTYPFSNSFEYQRFRYARIRYSITGSGVSKSTLRLFIVSIIR